MAHGQAMDFCSDVYLRPTPREPPYVLQSCDWTFHVGRTIGVVISGCAPCSYLFIIAMHHTAAHNAAPR